MSRWGQLVIALTLAWMPNQVQCLITCVGQARPVTMQATPACHQHGRSSEAPAPCPKTRLITAAVSPPGPTAAPLAVATSVFTAQAIEQVWNAAPRASVPEFDSSPPGPDSPVLRI